METIAIAGRQIEYEIRPSRRARRLGLTVYPGGKLVVTRPLAHQRDVGEFVRKHSAWVLRTTRRLEKKIRLPGGVKDYRANRKTAITLIQERVEHYNRYYEFPVGRITVKDIRTRWGSCSRRGNLNFSYKLLYLPPHLRDYVVVHELCHLKELNHSHNFWRLVAETAPQYKSLRSQLRSFVH